MKKKKLSAILALTLGITCLSACTDDDKNVVFGRYWQTNATVAQDVNETLEYDVSFKASTGMNGTGYTFTYDNGKYVTTLKSELADNGKTVYRYTTSLNIDVTYTKNGSAPETKSDWVETEVVFSTIGEALRPISSEKKFVSHTPVNSILSDSENCYTRYAYAVNTTYTDDGKGTSIVTMNFDDEEKKAVLEEQTFSCGSKYTYLDNEQVLFAIRGFQKNATSTTQTLLSYDASKKMMRKIEVAPSSVESSKDFNFTVNGNPIPADTAIDYVPVSSSYTDDMGGAPQLLWYAQMGTDEVGNPINQYRNVLLRMEVDAPYAIGTIVYSLKSAIFA